MKPLAVLPVHVYASRLPERGYPADVVVPPRAKLRRLGRVPDKAVLVDDAGYVLVDPTVIERFRGRLRDGEDLIVHETSFPVTFGETPRAG